MRTLDTSWETSGCRDALQIPATVGPDQARKVCQRVRNLYFQDRRIDFQSIYNLVQMTGDRWFNVPTMKSAFHHARKARVHLYLFAFQGRYAVINIINGIARKLGLPPLPAAVSHGDDYTYRSNSGNFTSHEGKIGEMYSGMIRHFVTTGEPRPSLPEYQISWRPFDPAKNDLVRQVYDDYVRLDTISDPMNLVNFWDSLNI
ncbi:unnamed protein product [Notodromas monacha]|uniref:Carboxylesterase type B domain-containing protein n=1 Tax=Notodromas monacha TaxID=399045 RepID=A0A7R9BER1_9CRUS|nr:unnamed protein product [Notodromas monacha]CAG0914023.1 unnamed protein product [Notodromas monacha]